jgi:hypothetical protein
MMYRVMQVYTVDAETKEKARKTLAQWMRSGLDEYPVQLCFESVRVDLDELSEWIREFKTQVLGTPRREPQPPEWKGRQS